MAIMKKTSFIGRSIILLVLGVLSACATLPTDFERPPSSAFTDTEDTFLGRKISKDAAAHPGLSGFFILPSGLDAFTARALTARRAERSIDAQYYLYHNDLIGKLFTWQLVQAADRGVRVRLLTNSLASNDVGLVHSGYSKYRKALLRGGVELYGCGSFRTTIKVSKN